MEKRVHFCRTVVFAALFIIMLNFNSASDQDKYLDYITKRNVIKETKTDQDRYMQWMSYGDLSGQRMDSIVYPLEIDKFIIPYNSRITPKQIAYLMLNAIFDKGGDSMSLPAVGNSFIIIVKNYIILKCHQPAGTQWIRMSCDESLFKKWLKIPDLKTFESLGKKQGIHFGLKDIT